MATVIFGTTDLAECLFWNLNNEQIKVDSFCVNEEYKSADTHFDIPVLTPDEVNARFKGEPVNIYICIGYHSMNKSRRKIFESLKPFSNFHFPNYISSSARVEAKQLGVGNLIFEDVFIGAYAEVGDFNIFYPRSLLAHHSRIKDYNFLSISSSVAGHVTVGNNCFFGNNSATKDKISISDYTLIGAGCYVSRETLPYEAVVPARSVSLEHRSIDLL